jgi:Smr domain
MSRKAAVMKVVNLEEGMPTVERARLLLERELQTARVQGYKAMKIIHGYGSSGVGGALRTGLQATLRRAAHDGDIAEVIYGENWRVSDERSWELLKRYPEWKTDPDLGRGNKGISIVVL